MPALRPQAQREAEEIFTLAKSLVDKIGDGYGVLRLAGSMTIVNDLAVMGKREYNLITISIGGKIVMRAFYSHDDRPLIFHEFRRESSWKFSIRKSHAAMEMEQAEWHTEAMARSI